MSIINNASPGSSIRLICIIDRVLTQKKGESISRQDLIDLCRPSNLPRSDNAKLRFGANLNFWLKEGLWIEDETGIRLISKEDTELTLQTRLLNLLIKDKQDITKGSGVEPFLNTITCLLAQEKFTFLGGNQLIPGESGNVAQAVNALLPPEMSINSSNESPLLLEYGFFLGFLDPFKPGYIVDPTQAIQAFIKKVFSATNELPIREFMKQVSILLPMIDGGIYREQIEPLMVQRGWSKPEEHKISFSLSHALTRLSNNLKIVLDSRSDDSGSMVIQIPGGEKSISMVRYMGNKS